MNKRRFLKKTVSMVLAGAMLGSTFAQYTIAEENYETELVIEADIGQAAEEPAVEAETQEVQNTAEESADTPETQDTPAAEAPEGQDVTEAQDAPVAEAPESQDAAEAQDVTEPQGAPAAGVPENQDAAEVQDTPAAGVPETQDAADAQDAPVADVPENQDAAEIQDVSAAGTPENQDAAEIQDVSAANVSENQDTAAAQDGAETAATEESLSLESGISPIVVDSIESVGEDSGIATISATEGDLVYEVLEDGTVKITGMKEGYDATQTNLVIPRTINNKFVTQIGDNAFAGHSHFTGTLEFPTGSRLTSIGKNAFKGCKFTGSLNLPSTVTSIGESAFSGCGFTGALELPAGLETISEKAFNGCSGFTGNLDLSGCTSLKEVGSKAFDGCSGFGGKLLLPKGTVNTDIIKGDAFFDTVRTEDGDGTIELQLGGTETYVLKAIAGNGRLDLSDLVTWKSSDSKVAEATNGTVTAKKAGSAEITATVNYNGKSVSRKIVVNAKEGAAPTATSVAFSTGILRPGTLDLTFTVTEGGKGIKALDGYFCRTDDPSLQIPFTNAWASPKFSGKISGTPLSLGQDVLLGEYYLGGMTLVDMNGKTTTYTYDAASGIWKNGNGNIVAISVNGGTNRLTVKDAFGAGENQLYITNDAAISEALAGATSGTAIVIRYDNDNHTVKGEWFSKIKGKDITLVLTNGLVEWCFCGKDVTGTARNIDCLASLQQIDTITYGSAAASMAIRFATGNGVLPGKATVRIRADQMNRLYEQKKALFLYRMNQDGTLIKSDKAMNYIQNNVQYWYDFEVADNSLQFIVSSTELNLEPANKVTSIKLNKESVDLYVGKSVKLKVTVGPDTALNKEVVWTSKKPKIATVTANGKVTAKRCGKTKIIAKAKDGSGVVAKCQVTVGYRIKYKLKGGTNKKKNPKTYYKTAVVLKNPTKKGYKFEGWYTDKTYLYYSRIRIIPKSYRRNMTLYAKWRKK